MPKNPTFTPELQRDLEDVIANGVFTYLDEFTRSLFPNYRTAEAQNCVAGALAKAVRRYETGTGHPIGRALALDLIEPTHTA